MSPAGTPRPSADGAAGPRAAAAEIGSVVHVRAGSLHFALTHRAGGAWLVADVAGRRGGVFASEAAALKFMREEAAEILPATPATALRRAG